MDPLLSATPSAEQLNQMRVHLMGLTVACPYDGKNPSDCPLCALRQHSMDERFDWADSLSAKEVAVILRTHAECLARKESLL